MADASSSNRARVALITHCPPEAPWSGERRRVAAVRAHLSRRYDCDVLLCPRDDSFGHRLRRKAGRPLAPPYAVRFQRPGKQLGGAYDFIWVFELWALSCIPRRLWSNVIWDKDTLMGASYASGGRRSRLMARWVAAYERYALRRVRHAFLSLPSDVSLVGMPHVTLLPHGFDDTRAAPARVERNGGPIRLGFVGLLSHTPNRTGLLWFAADVLPELQRASPSGVELWIAGAGLPDTDRRILEGTLGVKLKGYVRDLRDFYASVDVAVAPLRQGQGAPTKVMEAVGHGVPVAATACGLRGLPSDLHKFCVEAADDGWVDAIQRALDARDVVAAHDLHERHMWRAVLERHADSILEELGPWHSAPTT